MLQKKSSSLSFVDQQLLKKLSSLPKPFEKSTCLENDVETKSKKQAQISATQQTEKPVPLDQNEIEQLKHLLSLRKSGEKISNKDL